jgi:formylglycine-generating enzyme required for sulfatase activity
MNASAVSAAREVAPAATAVQNLFVTVPQTTLPNGTVVPAFRVGQYLCSMGADGKAAVTREGVPWTRIDYRAARQACAAAGFSLISELQALALAHHIAQQDINWTGGKVGAGALLQGLRNDTVERAQPGTFVPEDMNEARGFRLATGEIVFDVAGNAYTWVFDDVQGDAEGIVARPFAADSPSITTAPAPSGEKGVGWYPKAGRDWAGCALIRGGGWGSGSCAGAFRLGYVWPDYAHDNVGFRCTTVADLGSPVAA